MPVFLIGTQRSGSNLLRLMLNQSRELAAPHPPHVLQRMNPLLDRYGDLRDPERFALLVDDVCRLVDANPVAWRESPFDRERVLARCRGRSLVAVAAAVYEQQACDAGARDWVCKSMANVDFLDAITGHFDGEAKFIHLHRDGRDVALSFQKAPVGEKHVYSIAKQWNQDQRKALAHGRRAEAAVFRVGYEELTSEPRPVLERLCDFLGVRFEPPMLEAHTSREALETSRAGELWSNLTRPVLANSGKFHAQMPADDVRLFEAVAGPSLRSLGYPLVSPARGGGAVFTDAEVARFEESNRRLKERFLKAHSDSAYLKNRAPQEEVLRSIRDRAG